MTLFAGVFSRREDQPIPDSVCENLTRVISRDKSEEVRTFRDFRFFVAKVDVGAFSGAAFRNDDDGTVSVLSGEPLVEPGDNIENQNRASDLNLLHERWKNEDWSTLVRARGVFSAVHYQPQTGKLFLISDKLGIRPLFYWADERLVVFATALRIVENLSTVPKTMDLRAVTELSGLGYPLGSRTPYAGVSLLNAAEIVQVDEQRITRNRYWRWDEIEPSPGSEDALLSDLYSSFMRAVSLRLGRDKTTLAYLSGGLDSRCAVAALLKLNARVHTFNFALPNTQDYHFGNEFALQAKTAHEAIPKKHGDLIPDYSSLMASAWSASTHRKEYPAERSSLTWSGEGGSVALGHVHLTSEIAGLMRRGQVDEAIDTFLQREQASVTSRLLQSKVGGHLNRALHDGIREELDQLHCVDPARGFYLFLMLNDQRRKLASHFENLDLHRLEFQLPFFDSEFIARVVELPLNLCLQHKIYLKWLNLFPPVVTEVPWQSYPGHKPCPIPVQEQVAYQWDNAFQQEQAASLKTKLIEQAELMLRANDFPGVILRKQYLRIAAMIYKFGLRDYSYVIQAGWKYYEYWRICLGNYEPSSQILSDGQSGNSAVSRGLRAETELTSGTVK